MQSDSTYTHNNRNIRVAVALLSVVVIVSLSVSYYRQTEGYMTAYFSRVMREESVFEKVTIRGDVYSIVKGTVLDAHGKEITRGNERILRDGYQLALLRRDPLLGLTGTDPQKLRDAVRALEEVTDVLATAQKNARDAVLVRESLYPIGFLRSLATLEEARQSALYSGSENDLRTYNRALRNALVQGLLDTRTFKNSVLSLERGEKPVRLVSFGGTMTSGTLVASVDALEKRLRETQDIYTKRARCVSGVVTECESPLLSLPLPVSADTRDSVPEEDSISSAIVSVLTESHQSSSPQVRVELTESTCLKALPPPYVLLADESEGSVPVQFIQQLFFIPTEKKQGKMLQYFANTQGISFALSNPMVFYQCPGIQDDLGRISAIMATADFARRHPLIAERERRTLLSDTLSEQHARAYIRSAFAGLSDTADNDERNALIVLMRLFRERSAHMEKLVSHITYVETMYAGWHKRAVPVTIDARELFLTQSAFLSLFLAQNSSAGTTQPVSHFLDSADEMKLMDNYSVYTDLRTRISRTVMIENIQNARLFEKMGIQESEKTSSGVSPVIRMVQVFLSPFGLLPMLSCRACYD